ncbi:NAD(P)-binding domain-containing protein, partial [uncultured Actinomyces sp.]|uniref:NAD(P)-binding domain-containing protein n=1 Tax=uncultured Actinomyces sp. TaxID=249061 RepID=UPI00345823CF
MFYRSKEINMSSKIAVLGLGAMGLPMATNLSKKFVVTGFDPVAERSALATDAGITAFS